jgi:hypothetical protein
MQFFRGKDFADYLFDNFSLPRGTTYIVKAEEVDSEDEAYLFIYGPPAGIRNKETKSKFNGKSGAYILYSNGFHMSKDEIISATEKWFGSKIKQVIATHNIDGGMEVLSLVDGDLANFWWQKK